MAYTSGSATDWINLAEVLHTWLTGTCGWASLAYTAGNVDTGGMSMYLRAPGADTDKQVFINIQSVFDNTIPAYAWDVRGAIGYNAAVSFVNQPGTSEPTYFSLWKSTINYWFYASNRRVIVIAKCNNAYISMYAGFFLPWATPAQYPFPLFIGGSDGTLRAYNDSNSAHSSFVMPGGPSDLSGAKVRAQSGTWLKVCNKVSQTAQYSSAGTNTNYPFMFPYDACRSGWSSSSALGWRLASTAGEVTESGIINKLVPTNQGERCLMPVQIMNGGPVAQFGALDGIYFPMGNGLSSEQTATFDGRTFRVFAAITRTQSTDFFAVEEL